MSQSKIRCLLCDQEIASDETVCPHCGTPVPSGRLSELLRPESKPTPSGITKADKGGTSGVSEGEHICPMCSTAVDESMRKCPGCGVPLRHPRFVREEMRECPLCGVLSLESEDLCPKCGVHFMRDRARPLPESPEPELLITDEESEPYAQKKTVPPPAKALVAPALRVPDRGLTNGLGATNGTSLASARGAINGTGLVNGTGMTNGTGSAMTRTTRNGSRSNIISKWKFIAVLVVAVLLIPTFIFLASSHEPGPAVDGDFGDWSKAEMFGMQAPASSPSITVRDWSVMSVGGSLYVYISVAGTLMATSDVDSFYLFVDSDDSATTGYSVSGLGADYMVVLDGWDGEVREATAMKYSSTTDLRDWNSWVSSGSVQCIANSGKLEAMASLPATLDGNARYLLLSQASGPDKDFSVSYPVPEKGGLLIADLRPGPSVDQTQGTVPSRPGADIATLVLSCEGAAGTISAIAPGVVGLPNPIPFSEISLAPGEKRTLEILVDTSAVSVTNMVSVLLTKGCFDSTFADVAILQGSVHAYVASAPASIEIDGAFGDWLGRLSQDNDSSPVQNPNINISATGYAGMTGSAAFYVSVQGEMFKGVYAPSSKSKPSGSGGDGGGVTPSRKSGEDLLRIFIDSDLSNATGLAVTRGAKTIGADYMVDIHGLNGEIVSQNLLVYSGSAWASTSGTISVGKDEQRLELSVPAASIGGNTSIASIIETTDWKDRWDWAWAASVPDPWVVDSSGNAYQSDTGALWTFVGAPPLAPGDHIVDLILNMGGTEIYVLTNTGRTFYISIASPAGWVAGVTTPIDTALYSEAVSFTFYSTRAGYLLTANGTYFWCQDLGSFRKSWTPYVNKIELGVTDFTDMVYTKTGNTVYALRSGTNTRLDFSGNGGSTFTAQTSLTGSTTTQTDLLVIGAASNASDRLFVLCQNGVIRYSSNGGATWANLGNLPVPNGSNTTKYVGMGIDSTGYMWVVTDTGYCFRSTDTTTYSSFSYTGRSPIGGLVAIAPLPSVPGIPEFQYIMVPMMGMVLIVLSRRALARRSEPR